MIAGFLRQQVRRAIIASRRAPYTQLRVPAVGVRLFRTGAVESQVRIFHRQRPFDTERRNRWQIAVLLAWILDVERNEAGRVGNVTDRHFRALRNRQFVRIRGFHGVFSTICDRAVDATRILSCDRPRGTFESVSSTAIVVRQRTERGDRRAAQHEFALAERI